MFNVEYDYGDGTTRYYCLQWTDYATAQLSLARWCARYLNEDGSGKAYPNGKGYYPFRNPRIVSKD